MIRHLRLVIQTSAQLHPGRPGSQTSAQLHLMGGMIPRPTRWEPLRRIPRSAKYPMADGGVRRGLPPPKKMIKVSYIPTPNAKDTYKDPSTPLHSAQDDQNIVCLVAVGLVQTVRLAACPLGISHRASFTHTSLAPTVRTSLRKPLPRRGVDKCEQMCYNNKRTAVRDAPNSRKD